MNRPTRVIRAKTISFLSIAVLVLSSIGLAKYSGGSGEPNNPYQISSVADWQELMATPTDWGGHFILTSDIDLNGVFITPIAPDTSTIYGFQGTPFTGVFDGNDCVIRNADVNVPGSDYVGLFGCLATNGQIKNLAVEDASIFGQRWVGRLVGINGGTISNCYSTGNVTGTAENVGGLIGCNYGEITDCYSTGSVTGTGSYVGGLVGWNIEHGTITNCYSSGPVSGTIIASYSHVGGLVGKNGGNISNCYSTGPVSGKGSYVGGLVGSNYGTVSNSYSTGSVSGNSGVGGLVGYNCKASISDCYSTGSVSGTGSYVGGLVGYSSDGTVSRSFWNVNTSGRATSAGGTGRTTSQMQDINMFLDSGWDFVGETPNGTCNFWQMPESGGYPVLSTFNGYIPPEPSGSGTEADPYIITDVNQLGTVWYRPSEHYLLGNDIDLAGISWSAPIVPFFSGVLDGNEHMLRNVHVNVPSGDYVGLFGYLGTGGQIKNLGVEDVSIVGRFYVGGLVGYNDDSAISNCYSTGSISGTDYVGGLVGNNGGTISNCHSTGSISGTDSVGGLVGKNYVGTIRNCYSTGSVSGDDYVGGLVGENLGTASNCYSTGSVNGTGFYSCVGGLVGSNGGNISNCYSTSSVSGTIISSYSYVGGLVGSNGGTISDCYSTGPASSKGSYVGGLVGNNGGTISNCHSTGFVNGTDSVGGLVGKNYVGTIRNCYSTGSVSGNSGVGGLVGYNQYGNITNSYSTGTVNGQGEVGGLVGRNAGNISNCYSTGSGSGMGYYVGGLVGENGGAVNNCYSTGSVTGAGLDVGGLVGWNYGTVSNSFWDVNTSGWTTSAGGTPKTTAEMKTQSTFTSAGWDFIGETINGPNDVWRMCVDGVQYPLLSWQFALKGDFSCSDGVDILDLAFLVDRWLAECNETNNFCNRADINYDEIVNFPDFAILALHWLEEK